MPLFFAACDGASSLGEVNDGAASTRAAIAPHQFALVNCRTTGGAEEPDCHILAAGGKYFLFGAPDGAIANLLETELLVLDGVLLFSLLPDQLEGLDTIRNETWKRGRPKPLLVVGPEGTEAFSKGVDAAFEVPDAELFARESPAGGYDASLMNPMEVSPQRSTGTLVVDTGDLLVRGFYTPTGDIVYRVEYLGRAIWIARCGTKPGAEFLQQISADGLLPICNAGNDVTYIIE